MIWESITLMTIIDVLIVMVTLAALRILYVHRRELVKANLLRGVFIVVVGLLLIGLFYLGDLFAMWVLPVFVARATAMDVMTDLHLNYSWIIMLLGTLCLFAGFAYTIRGLLTTTSDLQKKTDQLEESNRDLYIEITERMQAEEALRKSEARYRTFVSNSYVGIWHVEARPPIPLHLSVEEQVDWIYEHVYFTDCNDAAARIYGFDAAENLIGQPIEVLLPRTHEANEAVIRRIVESEYDLVDDEWHEVNPAGDTVITLNSLVSTIEDRCVVEAWGVQIDVTERKQAEHLLRAITEGTATALGADFFRSLVRHLASAFQVRFAFVAECVDEAKTRARTLAFWDGDDFRDNVEFNVAGEPCEYVLGGTECYYPDDVQQLFPQGQFGEKAYLGVPLWGTAGNVLGHLAVMDDKAMNPEPHNLPTLKIFASRASAELERIRAEEALRTNEARLAEAQRIAQLGHWEWDLATNTQYWSDELYRIYGLAPQTAQVSYQTFLDVIHPDDRAHVEKTTEALLEGRHEGSLEFRIVRPDGQARTIWGEATLFADEEDTPIRVAGTTLDITERKQAEEALRESEARFRSLYNRTPVMLHSSDVEDRLVSVSDYWLDMLGYERDEVLGQPSTSFLTEAARHYAETICMPAFRKTGILKDEPLQLRKKNGEVIDIVLSAISERNTEGDMVRSLAVSVDVTERKRAEEALREYTDRLKVLRENDRAILAAQAPEVIAEVGLEHVHQLVPCTYANVVIFDAETRQVQLVGFHPDVAEPRRRSMRDLAGVLDLDPLRRGQVHRIPDIDDLPQTNPITQPIKALGLRSFLSVPLMAQGRLIGAMNIGFDRPVAYTEQHVEIANEAADSLAVALEHARLFGQVNEANTRLHSLSRQLVQAQEAERRTLARELHDQIGQTLTAVKLSLQAARHEIPNASDLDEHIDTVNYALDQVRTLSLDLRPSMLDDLGLVPALRWYVDRQARQAGFEGQVLAMELDERLPPELEVTCFRVAQEALTNIARHVEARQVSVTVRRTDTEVELIVKDDGKGFDVEQALAEAAAGTSMGLLSMQERVHLAGGRLTIRSQAGQGTEIRARFPVNT